MAMAPSPLATPYFTRTLSSPYAQVSGSTTKVIDTYLNLLNHHEGRLLQTNPDHSPSWCFRCAFWPIATQWFHQNPALCNAYDYTLVKRWSKRILGGHLHQLKTLIILINLSNQHWVCATAHFPTRTLALYDSAAGTDYDCGRDLLRHIETNLNDKFRECHSGNDDPTHGIWSATWKQGSHNKQMALIAGCLSVLRPTSVSKPCTRPSPPWWLRQHIHT